MKYKEAKELFLAHATPELEMEPDMVFNLFGITVQNRINFKDFLKLVPCTWDEVFRVLGTINFDNIKRIAKEIGQEMTDEEIEEMIEIGDLNQDGVIDQEEFQKLISKVKL